MLGTLEQGHVVAEAGAPQNDPVVLLAFQHFPDAAGVVMGAEKGCEADAVQVVGHHIGIELLAEAPGTVFFIDVY